MNGAVMKNFVTPEALFASALVGKGDMFVTEVDESDGSIALLQAHASPCVNNIALDHKSDGRAARAVPRFRRQGRRSRCSISTTRRPRRWRQACRTHGRPISLADPRARSVRAATSTPAPDGIGFDVTRARPATRARVQLQVPGAHNVSNALAALGAARACGLSLHERPQALERLQRHQAAARSASARRTASP